MAVKKWFITNRAPSGNTSARVLSEIQATSFGPVKTNTLTSSRLAGYSNLLNVSPLANNSPPYPDLQTINNTSVMVTEVGLNGSFAAGNWTFVLPAIYNLNGDTSFEAQWHARVRVFKSSYLASGSSPNTLIGSATEITTGSTGIDGTVAVSRSNQMGFSTVTLTLPQIILSNQYLVLFIGIVLDAAPTNFLSMNLGFYTDGYLQSTAFTPADPSVCILPIRGAREAYSYITPAGQEYPLDLPKSRAVISSEGEGLPPINYITQRGPFQDGVTLLDEFLQPRIVQLVIRHQYINRQQYTAGRQKLVGTLDPLLQTSESLRNTGTLRKYHMDGTVRDLACLIVQGPNFNPRAQEWDEWAYNEVLRFQAFDPVYTEPTLRTVTFAQQGSQLVGPMTGPIIGTTLDSYVTVNYTGTWKAYPTITITGPCAAVYISNDTTGEHLFINYPLAAGSSMVISLVQGAKSILVDGTINAIGYLSTDSDLATFHLTENNNGSNFLHAYASAVNASSLVSMSYQNRYLGI